MYRLGFLLFTFFLLLSSCKTQQINRHIEKKLNADFYENQFTGLLVFNPKTKDTIISYNASKYFIPASNTKIFTLYTALQLLPDSIPSFKYHIDGDTISIVGNGDPSFLHPYFKDSTALKMIKDFKKVKLSINNLTDYKYGHGWAWEDFDKRYNPERSSFPMYGNVISIWNKDSLQCIPSTLINTVQIVDHKINRGYNKNEFYYPTNKTKTVRIPLRLDSLLISKLWEDIAPNKIEITNFWYKKMQTAYSIPTDSILKRMMINSDNFLAEQLLILASSTSSKNLSAYRVRQSILKNYLNDLKQEPRWVDGSGLSRYNLFSPISFVQVLHRMYKDLPEKRLLSLFPAGGKSGTLKYWFKGNPDPYIYAKSGTLGNNYSLSGYLITKNGETLIFSFMNNHYRTSTKEVKERMQGIFEYLRDKY